MSSEPGRRTWKSILLHGSHGSRQKLPGWQQSPVMTKRTFPIASATSIDRSQHRLRAWAGV